MKDEIIRYFREREKLVTPDALELILKDQDPLALAKDALSRTEGAWITEESLKPKPPEVVVERATAFKAPAEDIKPQLRVFDECDVTGKSTSEGKVEDFIELFRDRFRRLSHIIKERGPAVRDIETLKARRYPDAIRVIGMVQTIKTTKNEHRIIEMEDETGTLTVLIPKSDQKLIRESQDVIPDEVIAVDGRLSRDLFIAKTLIRPDIAMHSPRRADEDVCVAMISDTHVGSKLFMRKNFERFLAWLNGAGNSELAGKIKYLTIAGDLVDGVGIYPEQEGELLNNDIFSQYKELHSLLEQVPDHIQIIAIPGNHDAVRVADPQPQISDEVLGPLADMDNFHMTSSPGYVSLHGVEMLLYHGASIHSIVPHVAELGYEAPEKVVVEYLKRRHVHPVYGERPPITPEHKDYCVIDRVPDFMQVADIHKNGYVSYKGVLGVNAGCWQSVTPYQIKQGHHPTPCILPVISLMTGKLSVVHFDKEAAQ